MYANLLLTGVCCLLSMQASAQSPAAKKQQLVSPLPQTITQTGDVALDLAIAELYAVISGPAGQKRDWEKFKAMFAPGAQLGVLYAAKDGSTGFKNLPPDEYIATSGKYIEEKGFYESELHRRVQRYGQLVHVWSTYEAREKQTDVAPLMRGINSIQLVKIGESYKIASLIWQPETKDLPLPADCLPHK